MPYTRMTHDIDPAKTILDEMGDISGIEIFNNQILCAIYIRPEKTKSGIILTNTTRDEDKWQGKVGLVIKKGPDACVDDTGKWFRNYTIDVGDWVFFRVSDGWSLTVNGVLCRLIDDTDIRGRAPAPDDIY
jgi:co-chaperonin GroES (HSP10)